MNQVLSPAKSYDKAVEFGEYKATCPAWVLFLKAFMGGYFAALGGHAAMVLASFFFAERQMGASKLAFGVIFSGALVCIVYTGSDLVTSNCMSFAFLAYRRKVSPLTYLARMGTSFLGNYAGAVAGAAMLTGGTGFFIDGVGPATAYLQAIYDFKMSLPFWRIIFSAIGCNSYVCMAVWSSYVTLDSAGSILIMVLLITSFAVAGFEHVVANMYTMHAALISCSDTSAWRVYVYNLLPTLIGNYIGGSFVIALPIHLMYGLNKSQGPVA